MAKKIIASFAIRQTRRSGTFPAATSNYSWKRLTLSAARESASSHESYSGSFACEPPDTALSGPSNMCYGEGPAQTITSSNFNSLIGVTFDASNNLWVASYENNQVESISASTLNTANPVITVNLIQSPSSPVALAFAKDGTLWVVGQYGGGILLHFPTSQLSLGYNAVPDYCLATTNVGGCQYINNVFLGPEGIALFNGDVWVANNSTGSTGTVPGREIVDLKYSGGTLTVNATFGSSGAAASSPFVCLGGLYASTTHVWLNDESYNETNPQCGANGDVASRTGGVFSFTAAQLAAKTTTVSQVLAFSNITGRPGFGGIFVEND